MVWFLASCDVGSNVVKILVEGCSALEARTVLCENLERLRGVPSCENVSIERFAEGISVSSIRSEIESPSEIENAIFSDGRMYQAKYVGVAEWVPQQETHTRAR